MARRFTYERVIATLVGSNEYYRLAGRTNTGFVDKAFADILGPRALGVSSRTSLSRVAAMTRPGHRRGAAGDEP